VSRRKVVLAQEGRGRGERDEERKRESFSVLPTADGPITDKTSQ